MRDEAVGCGGDGGGFAAGHAARGAKGAVRVTEDIHAVALGFLRLGDSQLTVFIRFAAGGLVQIVLDGDIFILLRDLLVVGDDDCHLMLGIHIRAIRQDDRDVAGLADGNITTGDGTLGVRADDFDGQGPAVTVCILIATGDLAVLIGLATAGGNGDLARGVGLTGGIVIILVCNGNAHARYSALILDKLHGDGRLVGIVQQAAIRQADGDAVVFAKRHGSVRDGVLGVGIGDSHEIAAHDGLAPAVRGATVVDLVDLDGFQRLTAVFAFLVLAALGVGGRLLVDDPVARLVTGRLGVVALVAVTTAGAGVGGVAHLRAGRSRHFTLVIVTERIFQHSAAAGAELGFRAGGRIAGNMTSSLVAFNTVITTADAAVLHNALAGAGGVGDERAFIPAVAQRSGVVRHEAAAAAIAAVDGLTAALTGRGDHMGFVVMGQNGSDVLDMAVAADGALADGVAGVRAGGSYGMSLILMLALGRGGLLHLAAAGAELQQLAIGFAGGIADDDALPCVAERVHIVALFDLAALGAEVTVIAKGDAASLGAVQQNEVVVFAAALVGAAVAAAVLVLAAAVGIIAAAGAFAILTGLRIAQPDICHAVFRHADILIGVGDLVINRVLTFLRVIGRGGHGAAFGAVAVADGSADASFGEVADGDRVGLAVHDAVVVCNDRLGCCVVIAGVVAQAALLHGSKAAVGRLGQHLGLHAVALQRAVHGVVRTVAKRAVGATFGGNGMVGIVRVLVGHGFLQLLCKFRGAVKQPVNIFEIAVIRLRLVCVDTAAGFADCLGIMIAGIIGVFAGNTVHAVALADTVHHRAVRVFDVTAQSGLAVAGILGNAEYLKGRYFAAFAAFEGFTGHDAVDVQLIRAVGRLHPVFGGVMVAVLLGRKSAGDQAEAQCQRQEHGQRTAGKRMILVQVHISSLDFLMGC